jgi:hypothetical protein
VKTKKNVSNVEFWWFWFGIAAVGLTVAAAVAGVIALYFSVLMAREGAERTKALELDISTHQERVAQAERRAVELTKLAEDERLARIQAEERLRGRRITPAQHDAFVKLLLPYAGTSVKVVRLVDLEASLFADDITKVLRDAGWEPQVIQATTLSPPVFGIRYSENKELPAVAAIAVVLKSMETPVAQAPPERGTAAATIIVGLKPPA